MKKYLDILLKELFVLSYLLLIFVPIFVPLILGFLISYWFFFLFFLDLLTLPIAWLIYSSQGVFSWLDNES